MENRSPASGGIRVLIASWLEPELVERIRSAHPDIPVDHAPELLRPPRYPADHKGADRPRTASQEARWQGLLARATVLFDFDQTHLEDLPEVAPHVRWIQATSAGIGQFVRRMRYAERMPDTVFTTASGVHARPLAEFAIMSMLMHQRRALDMIDAQRRRHWERFAGTDSVDRCVVVLGYGAIGHEVGRMAQELGMRVIGIRRHPEREGERGTDAVRVLGPAALPDVLPQADYLVLIAPHTGETEGAIGAAELELLPRGAVVINIGRGALMDEAALVDALASGHVGGAYLDVFAEEPLPASSPLWSMPQVLVSPHSGSTSDRENARIADLFIDNLDRYKTGGELRNVLDTERLY